MVRLRCAIHRRWFRPWTRNQYLAYEAHTACHEPLWFGRILTMILEAVRRSFATPDTRGTGGSAGGGLVAVA